MSFLLYLPGKDGKVTLSLPSVLLAFPSLAYPSISVLIPVLKIYNENVYYMFSF